MWIYLKMTEVQQFLCGYENFFENTPFGHISHWVAILNFGWQAQFLDDQLESFADGSFGPSPPCSQKSWIRAHLK